jgi:hypothetical protein
MDKMIAHRLPSLVGEQIEYFGHDKWRAQFTLEAKESLSRYKNKVREGLYAIVMPSCSGKTQICKRFGFIDVDCMATRPEHELLNLKRIKALETKNWKEHNDEWLEMLNETLNLMYTVAAPSEADPLIIMVQSEMTALSIGATPLAGFAPTDELFGHTRDDLQSKGFHPRVQFAELNRREFQVCSAISMKHKGYFNTYDEGVRMVIKTLMVNGLPTPAPWLGSRSVIPVGYDECVPDWILSGDKSKRHVQTLVDLYKTGGIPRCAMTYFLKDKEIPSSYGFGIQDGEWAAMFAILRWAKSKPDRFGQNEDPEKLFPYKYEKNLTRANVTVRRLVKSMDVFSNNDCYEIATHHYKKPNNFVSAVLVSWLGLWQFSALHEFYLQMACVAYENWGDVFKMFHGYVRLNNDILGRKISERERHEMMYWDQLLGKEVEPADWKGEIADRTWDYEEPDHKAYDPNLQMWTTDQYRRDFRKALEVTYCRLGSKGDASIQSFDEFYERRGEWLTKGSTVYTNLSPDDRKYSVELINGVGELIGSAVGRHNKKSLFETMHALEANLENEDYFNISRMVTKLDENGHKKRNLLPGSLSHFVVFAFVLWFMERDGQIGCTRINAPADDDIAYFENKMGNFGHWMFDWMNFNLYHSQWEMASVIEYLDGTVFAPEEHSAFVIAIAESMYNMYIQDPEGEVHKAGRGLYSGWRGTSAMNNILNDVYCNCCEMSFSRLQGRDPTFYRDSGGDDVDAGLNRMEDGYILLYVMRQMEFKASDIKQMLGQKAEFFRNTITADGIYASPLRAVTTFVNGKWEGTGNVPIKERVPAILDQVAKVMRRGFSEQMCNNLAVMALSHWCRINDHGEWLDLPATVVHGRLEDNGFGIPDTMGMVWVLKDRVPDPILSQEVSSPPGRLVTTDMINVLARELHGLNVSLTVNSKKLGEMAATSFDTYQKHDYTPVFQFETECIDRVPAVAPKHSEELWLEFREWVEAENAESGVTRLLRFQEYLPYMTINGSEMTRDDLAEILGISGNMDVMDFKGEVYYRRLIAEPLARLVTEYCMNAVENGGASLEAAEEAFRILCYMCYRNLEFMI